MPGAPSPLAVTWAGHATVLIEQDGARLLTDPLLRDRVGPLVRTASPVSPEVSERLDAVLLSHLHADHADPRSLRKVGGSAPVLAPRGAGRWLKRHGVRSVEELSAGEQVQIGAVQVSATPAAHPPRRRPYGVRAEPIGFLVTGTQRCYFAGDTDLFAELSACAGGVDLALLPIWGWGSSVGPGHLDPERASVAVQMIAPRVAVPIHWGTLTLALRRRGPLAPCSPATRFSTLVRARAPAVEVRVIAPGQRTELLPAAHTQDGGARDQR
jgi:L-ascorbate metabolism protein UlaG (beta-lactamase superfamily)